MASFRCPHCGREYPYRDSLLGREVKCAGCVVSFTIAAPMAAAAVPTAPTAAPQTPIPQAIPAAMPIGHPACIPTAVPIAIPVGTPIYPQTPAPSLNAQAQPGLAVSPLDGLDGLLAADAGGTNPAAMPEAQALPMLRPIRFRRRTNPALVKRLALLAVGVGGLALLVVGVIWLVNHAGEMSQEVVDNLRGATPPGQTAAETQEIDRLARQISSWMGEQFSIVEGIRDPQSMQEAVVRIRRLIDQNEASLRKALEMELRGIKPSPEVDRQGRQLFSELIARKQNAVQRIHTIPGYDQLAAELHRIQAIVDQVKQSRGGSIVPSGELPPEVKKALADLSQSAAQMYTPDNAPAGTGSRGTLSAAERREVEQYYDQKVRNFRDLLSVLRSIRDPPSMLQAVERVRALAVEQEALDQRFGRFPTTSIPPEIYLKPQAAYREVDHQVAMEIRRVAPLPESDRLKPELDRYFASEKGARGLGR